MAFLRETAEQTVLVVADGRSIRVCRFGGGVTRRTRSDGDESDGYLLHGGECRVAGLQTITIEPGAREWELPV